MFFLKGVFIDPTAPLVLGWIPCVQVTSYLKCIRLVYVRPSFSILHVGSIATPFIILSFFFVGWDCPCHLSEYFCPLYRSFFLCAYWKLSYLESWNLLSCLNFKVHTIFASSFSFFFPNVIFDLVLFVCFVLKKIIKKYDSMKITLPSLTDKCVYYFHF